MPFVHIGKEKIYYESGASSSAATALVSIHGSGASNTHWPHELADIPNLRTYTPDLPGHGQSTGNGRSRVEDYADFIDAFVTALDLQRVILMGHSLGGAIALTSALRAPAWLSGLILAGTGARLRVTPTILDGLLSDYQRTLQVICNLLFGPSASPSLIESVRAQLLVTDPRITHGDFSACNQFDIMNRIGEIMCPTLVLSGADDMLTPLKYGDFICSRISGAKHAIIEGAGHMMALEKTADFIAAVTLFSAALQATGK